MQKLELTWIGKGEEPRVEPRILLHDAGKDYGDPDAGNMLIHGDNLLALKALEQEFAGRVKCVYIDPPYNTGAAFEHYNDNLEHSTWLSLMTPRLRILRNLLSEDGSIWISIDDDEGHYLKVLCDEILGRSNLINTVIWEKKYTIANDAKWFSDNHDFILVYAKDKENWRPNLLPRTNEMNAAYSNPDNHPKGPWKATPLHAKSGSDRTGSFSHTFRNGVTWQPPTGTYPRFSAERLAIMDANNEIWFGRNGAAIPSRKTFLYDLRKSGIPSRTVWRFEDVGHNHEAREEVKAFNSLSIFATPKPERLIERVLTLGSNPGDLVLDSFLGSGTTAAVAHKMGRRYIGIELGEHCYTHCLPRLRKVVDGEQGGISRAANWQGGGGFKFYELAPTLIVTDKHGQPVISGKYNAETLVAAVAKLHGFTYAPDAVTYWKQGRSQDNSYIYVTTQYLSAAELDAISRDLPEYERLMICAPAFDLGLGKRYENIQVRKIPQSVLSKCEYGADNYNLNILNIVNPPELDEEGWEDA
jgi:adenine-specific DNA-methyltransferase